MEEEIRMQETEQHRRKEYRLKNFDYSYSGVYFITICTKDRRCTLWDQAVGAACGRPALSKFGEMAETEINRIATCYGAVKIDKHVVMPNHIHLIIRLGTAIDAATVDKGESQNGRPQAALTVSRIMNQFKGAVSKKAGKPVWQKLYHDHVIRCEADYEEIGRYIDENPQKWIDDKYWNDLK